MALDTSTKNLGFGAGFRQRHKDRILSAPTRLDWFEVISENYFGLGETLLGPSLQTLSKLRERYPIALHGVSLSIGSSDPLNPLYLKKLKALIAAAEPAIVSDHLCWTGLNGHNLHDLLPLPYTEEAIRHVSERILRVQDELGRRILIENVSSYLTYAHSEMAEWEFISEVAERADCGLLLDINNIFVSSFNHGFDPLEYLEGVPLKRVGQIHLAGHTDEGTHLIDTHDHPVPDPVWTLYEAASRLIGPVPTMVEWDASIPEFEVLEAEALKAKSLVQKARHEQAVAP
ncbi:MAG TPA: DUF692 domain-containing protein [Bdellovibrionales bacterium]|nr:DUF692 domain-containing protein [Bdellovibrionales bacterium]